MVLIPDAIMLEHTFFTNDVLPMRRGEMRTVLTPFSKFSLIAVLEIQSDSFCFLRPVGEILAFNRYSEDECLVHAMRVLSQK